MICYLTIHLKEREAFLEDSSEQEPDLGALYHVLHKFSLCIAYVNNLKKDQPTKFTS